MASRLRLNISTDFEDVCNDFQTTLTLRARAAILAGEPQSASSSSSTSSSSSLPTDVTIPYAQTEPAEWRELDPSNAQVIRKGVLFAWSKSRSVAPQVGDIVIDAAGTYWTVWKVRDRQQIETYDCLALNLNIVTADENQATVLVGTFGKGAANEARAIWSGLLSGVVGGTVDDVITARFQPSEETSQLEFGSEWSRQTYRVYFKTRVPLQATGGNYRLVDQNGSRYRVVRYYEEHRIDRLPVAIAVRIVEGAEYFNPAGTSGSASS